MTKSSLITVVLSCLLLVAPLVQAQLVAPVHVIPVVAKSAGVGTSSWLSDVSISNVSDEAAVVGISFFRENTAHTLIDLISWDKTVTIQAGATLLVEDVLGTWFPSEGNTKGFLLVAISSIVLGEADGLLAVASRTYDAADPNATYGQTVPSTVTSVIFGPGRVVMSGAREDARFRSNVGVVNIGMRAVDVVISIYDGAGAQLAQRTKNVKALSMSQWSLGSLGVPTFSGAGRVEVRIADSSLPADPCQYEIDLGQPIGMIGAYLSKADSATNDAEFVLGQIDWSELEAECGSSSPDDC